MPMPHAYRAPRTHGRGFSLVELLVVIGIIGLLVALLLPVLSKVRHAARATQCLINLQQWGQAYQAYIDANHGHSLSAGPYPDRLDKGVPPMWWELLQPHHPETKRTLLCPEATEAANETPRNAFQAWGPWRVWDSPSVLRATVVGSYGFNGFLGEWVSAKPTEPMPSPQTYLPRGQSSLIPLIFDCAYLETYPRDTDPALLYYHGAPLDGMSLVALDRHRTGVNVVFVDTHAEYVASEDLWKLKWSKDFAPKQVTIPR
jgi:prepilin-type N-terminal cleavage/methylation domain-containing protein/prepilin-type processing-associated H-X9-DG protein